MSLRHIFITIFIFAFLFSSYDEDISTAINQLYNFEINKVINNLEKIAVSYPEDPLIPFLRLSAYWQHSLLYDNPESSYEVIENGVRQAIPLYVDMIEKYPDEQKYNLFLGSLYGLKARVDLAQSDWMGLVVSGSRGFRYISEAIEEDPYLYDAYMPIGTLEYFLCRSNSALQMIGKLFGLKSDCDEAVRKLELSSSNAEYSWVEAKNVLSYIYLYIEKDYFKAYNVSNSLTQSFPGHPFFLYLEAESLIKLNEYEEFNKIDELTLKDPTPSDDLTREDLNTIQRNSAKKMLANFYTTQTPIGEVTTAESDVERYQKTVDGKDYTAGQKTKFMNMRPAYNAINKAFDNKVWVDKTDHQKGLKISTLDEYADLINSIEKTKAGSGNVVKNLYKTGEWLNNNNYGTNDPNKLYAVVMDNKGGISKVYPSNFALEDLQGDPEDLYQQILAENNLDNTVTSWLDANLKP